MSSRTFLITGATGKQGGAVLRALLEQSPSSPPNILAITRNPSSTSAKRLTSISSTVSLIQGDLDDCPAIFKSLSGRAVDGVFSVQMPAISWRGIDTENETVQGNALINAAADYGVKHFVFSSVDRGGPRLSAEDDTNVPHFASKARIERHLIERAKSSDMTYTILRTVGFFDNLVKGFEGKFFTTGLWSSLPQGKKLQLISTKDIGIFGAKALLDPSAYQNEALTIAGDELDFSQGTKVFEETIGMTMPMTYGLIASFMKWMIPDLGFMSRWFNTVGFGADIPSVRKRHPGLLDFKRWLQEESQFKQHSKTA
ncbi:MAG: hypothetical protein Q9160_002693 [Pyrenula sp. 1 TL-2023]